MKPKTKRAWALPTERSGKIDLVAGRRYPIVMEYYGTLAEQSLSSSGLSPNQPKQIVPNNLLFFSGSDADLG